MAAAARKPIANGDLKRILPMKKSLDLAKEIENNMHQLERGSIETASAMAESCKQAVAHWGDLCMNGIRSCVHSSGESIDGIFGIGHTICEGSHKTSNDLLALSRETMECRSIDEFFNIQRKAGGLIMAHWMEELRRMNYAMPYSYGSKSVLPPD